MRTSENGVDLIKRFEGLELQAYQDIAGIWTIGYGHTGPDVEPGMRISERDAEELLKTDLRPREEAVSRLVSVSLNQNEFDALVSFIYNVGIEAFRKSTARKRLNANNRLGAAEALTWWNKATVSGVLREVNGLTRRRASERGLFLSPTGPAHVADNKQLQENTRITPFEDAPRRGNIAESRSIQGATVAGGAGVAASSIGKEKTASELNQQQLDELQGGSSGSSTVASNDSAATGDTTAGTSTDGAAASGATTSGDNAGEEAVAANSSAEGTTGASSTASDVPAVVASNDAASAGDGTTSTAAPVTAPTPSLAGTREMVSVDTQRPFFERKQSADDQIQFALMILIVLSVAYIFFARIDDWWRYKR